ncbi:hypothetical protein [Domibacillus tundrae]|uniref:hypothetical protein n=1 Tax=Domibacillus tundrae TaxID=1587527 RepID=UPI0006182205|nr:hypothetical protein [Domibacillus tundrae]
MRIAEEAKEIFAEQARVSSQKIENLRNDTTPEGTKEFYHHVAILEDIKTRLEIVESSKKSLSDLKEVLGE